ncbi:glycosyltransferase [Chromobacterium violaceum]|uniref:glycosyltransferase family 2 protein n=1 Tax=Chromobacterium violaceum TaxID=536 RepID=UPI001E55DAB8|nr:glycosyltransferase [Chromobacterium violaceum]MCD0495149.1 glycosyltransferase [Chromobacterium violaceum]
MTILNQAISAYRNEDFANALQLFYQAGEAYGSHLVATNIRLCQQALTEAGQSSACPPRISAKLDPATRIMLANAAELELTEAERTRLLAEYRLATHKKSEDAETQAVNPIPADWPKDLVLPPLPDSTNDYLWNRRRKSMLGVAPLLSSKSGLSIIIPTFNRSRILDVTLACLCNQQTRFPFEVIVADDGSREAIDLIVRQYESLLDIKYARQKDYGYQLCAVRNLGLRTAQYDFVAILDCDMAPNPLWVQSYMELLVQDDDVALIGPRKYVDTSSHNPESFRSDSNFLEKLPEIITNNDVAGKTEQTKSIDWRLDHFHKSDDLRLCDTPFRFFSGGNVAFAKKWLEKAGYFDEAFNHWGGEDNEFGYRLYRAGCYFQAVSGALAYHQEPPGKENETDRAAGKAITIKLVQEKVPYFYRKLEEIETANLHAIPLVSIYIPAYNCAEHIVRCVNSALNQTVTDLEVCICDDGSTDSTLEIINQHFGGNPRVRVMSKSNGGIGSASNAAVRMARGYYIGQLDSDDYLEPDAVELCLKTFFSDRSLVCVYTTNRNVNPDGSLIANGYNWPEYSREKLMTAMILHHFRMFTARAWNLTSGFDEEITNAVDYDMFLKLSEVGKFRHINKVCYNRVLHGGNTSIVKLDQQKINHFSVVNSSFQRLGVSKTKYEPTNSEDPKCRKYKFTTSVHAD